MTDTNGKSAYGWTSDEIADRLGTSTIVFERDRLLQSKDIAMIAERGIRHIEVCGLGNPGHLDVADSEYTSWLRTECESAGISIVSTHCPGYLFNSDEEDTRKKAVEQGVATAKNSEELGAGVMVCHFRPEEPSEKTIHEMLDRLEGTSIKLTIENGQDLADYTAFVDKVGSDRFGMVVDIGHTRDDDEVNPFIKAERARETMAQCGHRLFHLHLHDWVDRDHFSPLDGDIAWAGVFDAFKDIDYQGYYMFEAAYPPGQRGDVAPAYVLDKVAGFPQGFVERYVGQ